MSKRQVAICNNCKFVITTSICVDCCYYDKYEEKKGSVKKDDELIDLKKDLRR